MYEWIDTVSSKFYCRLPTAACLLLLLRLRRGGFLVGHGRHDPHLQLRLDLVPHVDIHRVQAELLERSLQSNLVGGDVKSCCLRALTISTAPTEP